MSKLRKKFCLDSAVTFGKRRSVNENSTSLKLNETEQINVATHACTHRIHYFMSVVCSESLRSKAFRE